jgi:hypothetical protein
MMINEVLLFALLIGALVEKNIKEGKKEKKKR